ncbi:MAG TPA: DNA-formamidopyrimidine glycosylase family protein [Gemmatimonadaceae bacterium]|jgi:formamidopyrimidine-DNA glycosylase|nr:DNA-formamidopyrimidine glycosylase family protein [Gemmatimonadaceae bacterium]
MPELPDVTIYVEAIARRVVGEPLVGFAVRNVFALRSVDPPLDALVGRDVRDVRRLGKRIVLDFGDELHLVVHLMIAGRFRWIPAGSRMRVPARIALSGIGNAYSDEILHRARLSPLRLTSKLGDDEVTRLHDATRATLVEWTERLRAETGDGFPEKVTAFREGMAVHGRYREPCPDCGTAVQRIRYRDNETNYCPRCQTEGRLLADRALSRLLHEDWPKTIDELEG